MPLKQGDALASWSVASVQCERRRLRVRLQRGPVAAGLSVHPVEGHPQSGPFDVGGFRIYTEGNALPIAELADAAQALQTRLRAIAPDQAAKTMRTWARRSRGGGGGGETFEADGPASEWLGDLRDFLESGGTGARLRGALAILTATDVVSALAKFGGRVRLEPTIDGAADDASITASLRALSQAHLRGQLIFTPDAASVAHLGRQLSLAMQPIDGTASPIESVSVQLPSLQDFEGRKLRAPKLDEVARALAEAHANGTRRVRFSSRLGEPACLFPSSLRLAVLPSREPMRAQVPSKHGPECDRCALKPRCAGVSQAYAERFGTLALRPFVATGNEPSWADKARWLLMGRTGESITLREVMREDEIPRWPCHLPWTRLELGDGGPVGPCCMEYQVRPEEDLVSIGRVRSEDFGIRDQAETPEELWNGPRLRSFRREMLHGGQPKTCRSTCPVLVGGTYLPKDMILWGGPAASVEGQIKLVEDMQAGAEIVRSPPQSLCVTTTSYCNYKCVMCDFHERGTLADEKPDRFWSELEKWLGSLQQVDANGGEPLASPAFRAFLERARFQDFPQLGISLTTNLSYLTPRQLERFEHVPLASLTISVNAATPATYLEVMRGLTMDRWRENIEAVLARRARKPAALGMTYSFVILKSNVHEIEGFYELTKRDDVYTRYMLPMRDLNHASIMTAPEPMERAREALERVAADMRRRGRDFEHSLVQANLKLLSQRLADGIFEPL